MCVHSRKAAHFSLKLTALGFLLCSSVSLQYLSYVMYIHVRDITLWIWKGIVDGRGFWNGDEVPWVGLRRRREGGRRSLVNVCSLQEV